MSGFDFELNGERIHIEGVAPTTTLLAWMRQTGRTGAKEGCNEGDCGACAVSLLDRDAEGRATWRTIHACLVLLPMLAGRVVVSVEGVALPKHDTHDPNARELHPVQRALVERQGSQCGYCTPGFVAAMFEGYYRRDLEGLDESQTRAKVAEQLDGNLCRCTGYRPIRDAMMEALAEKPKVTDDPHRRRLDVIPDAPAALTYEACGERFLRPTSYERLLRLRAAHPEAWLIAGSTEISVYKNKRHQAFPLLVSIEGVPELARVERDATHLRVGGGVTLTALEESLDGEFPALAKMLRVFASRPVRNRATLAGNLVTASPIGDMAPVLLALGAELVLASVRGERALPLDEFFLGYRKTALAPDELVRWILIPRPAALAKDGHRRLVASYKVSKRRELDISIVAAGFSITLAGDGDAARIVEARLGYGGVAPTPSRARRTEALLVGKPWTRATIDEACASLEAEFAPIDDVRAQKGYRRQLVASLFEKLFDGAESGPMEAPLDFAQGAPLPAPTEPIGRTMSHEAAVGHVTGAAQYVDDTASKRGGFLEIWPVRSPHARARIVKRDATAARAMPGVRAVLLAEDVPGLNDVGAIRHDEPLLARDEVQFHGQAVAMVVGDSYDACRRAAAAVVVEYEPLPPILGVRAAIEAGTFHSEPHVIARGDVDAALAKAKHRLSGELETGAQEHLYLETHAAWAEVGDEGDLFVSSSTQHPAEVQATVSHVLDLPRNKVVVVSPRMGGAFGGKETQGNYWASAVALAAWVTRRPVRVQLERDLDVTITGKRHPFLGRYEIGFDDEGHIEAAKLDLVSDGGFAFDLSQSILDRALYHADSSYFVPNIHLTGRIAKTNVVSHTAYRGFGGPQGMLVMEEAVSRVAQALGLAPEVVRARNLYSSAGGRDVTPFGQPLGEPRIERIWSALSDSSQLAARKQEIATFNAESPRIKRGIAITPVKFGISFTASLLNQAGSLVLLYRDGTAQVSHGGTEMGQGLHTKMQGVAMRELGLRAEAVRVMQTRTDKVPNTSATAASSGADLNGAAVKAACETLRARLAPVALELLREGHGLEAGEADLRWSEGQVFAAGAPEKKVPIAAVTERAHARQVSMAATGYYATPGLSYDRVKGQGRPFHYFTYGAAVTEVEVDGYTGMKRVRRVDVLHDVGESLNPGLDRGQVEGAFVQGMGWLTAEEMKWDAQGRILSSSASTYPIPSTGDAPADFRVALLPMAAQPGVIHGSKAVGEPPFMLAISVREALKDAIAAFARAGHADPIELACPATHEAIFAAIQRVR
jgi:xanthine dehydrogenase molybdopterin binding subunit/xanthine dehydrogenase small subunit